MAKTYAYEEEMYNNYLNETKIIKADTTYELNEKRKKVQELWERNLKLKGIENMYLI